jgi:hypothetical protein
MIPGLGSYLTGILKVNNIIHKLNSTVDSIITYILFTLKVDAEKQ